MAGNSRFIIKRKDNEIDDIVLESEGLTIGRLIGNDLCLNHRAVSRTHAGIKEISGDFWLFNLSKSNGTLLNGELVEKTPLAEGDQVQIGPYLLRVSYVQTALSITVEMKLEVQPIEGQTTLLSIPTEGGEDSSATLLVKIPRLPSSQATPPGGTKRLQGTGLLNSLIPAQDEQALDVFWDKRKREAGKINEQTPLRPRGNQKLGKAQFNWRPTLDLRRLWRKSYFSWGVIGVALVSLAGYFAFPDRYLSPDPVAAPHSKLFTKEDLLVKNFANASNNNSCSSCHAATGMYNQCVDCHQTEATQAKPAFTPSIYDAHLRQNILCADCHIEHMGEDKEAGLLNYGLCLKCHNESYKLPSEGLARGEKTRRAGDLLGSPHGGALVGKLKLKESYPIAGDVWKPVVRPNRLKLAKPGDRDLAFKYFHDLHIEGDFRDDSPSCANCHAMKGGRLDNSEDSLHDLPHASCSKCHITNYNAGGDAAQLAKCNTCHQQHGQAKETARIEPEPGKKLEFFKQNEFLASVGSAYTFRQDKETLNLDSIHNSGALPWYGWLGLIALAPVAGLVVMAAGTLRRKYFLSAVKTEAKPDDEVSKALKGTFDLEQLKAEGPAYPHPVVNPVTCIGCHACVEACPHDVLAIVNGISVPVAMDQCMEDTSCQVECPTNPKSCVVINTTKVIPKRKVPARDQKFKTNVDGIYLIGDVSGVPLIKNAINEGGQVIDHIVEEMGREGPNPKAEFDVAIIGIGPAGLSAAVLAQQRGLDYIAIEQDTIVATIQATYPAGKYVFFKPDTVEAKGGIPLPGVGDKKEEMLKGWFDAMTAHGVVINEGESCKDIKNEDGIFVVSTEKGKVKEVASYKARKVILAIGNRGTPMKLKVPGEEIKFLVQPKAALANHCPRCGKARRGEQRFCVSCGTQLPVRELPPFEDSKVKYRLSDPDEFVGKKCIVVGAGNSSIESAVDLTGFKRDGDQISFTRNNEVTLVVRSDFKGDLKLGNKMNVYDCIDAGKIKVYFRTEIKEITEKEVVLMDVRSKEEKARIANDYVFALIGGEKPTKFLEGLGIKVG